MATIETVTGPIDGRVVDTALPHEHVFVDFLGPRHPDYGRVDRSEVRSACVERLARLRPFGVDLLVDCTAIGIGRDVELLREVSRSTGIRIVCSTGIYKALVPPGGTTSPPRTWPHASRRSSRTGSTAPARGRG